MKKYLGQFIFIFFSWLILFFVYNYRVPAQKFGVLIPTFMACIAILNSNLFNNWIIPKYYFWKAHFQFFFYSFAVVVLGTYFQMLFVFGLFVYIKFDLESVTPRLQDVLVIVSSTWLVILAGIATRQTKVAVEKATKQEALQKEKVEIELKMLKSQINPHFLFNTLNSIYVLAKKKSDETPQMVLKLSDILDFLLYECNSDQIEIGKEIEFIKDYLDLEKLRYGHKLELNISINLETPHKKIEPMLMIPLVENAFKHGVKPERKKAVVDIDISDALGLNFRIENSIPSVKSEEHKEGIGLANLKGRLEKLYPDQAKLELINNESSFFAHLSIVETHG
ncbi:histidine kinase [Flammeovirgaceae bacterium SG7u.111]|nr:histidine kinase [Flammeovirgaceae bacterium SG7u.132]WPO33817.1 histidine kinase [Flammeovirgaceae bacterium SG7u.111]